MFTTDDERPITAPPTTVTHPLGGVMVLVGTGKLFEVGDNKRPDTARGQVLPVESIYGLWDYTRLVPMRRESAPGWMAARKTRMACPLPVRR